MRRSRNKNQNFKRSNEEARYWIFKQSKAIFDNNFPKSEHILIKFGIQELKEHNQKKKQKQTQKKTIELNCCFLVTATSLVRTTNFC